MSWWYNTFMEELINSLPRIEWLEYKQGLEKRNREKKERLKEKYNLLLSYVDKVGYYMVS
jgi:hypothetical protein